MIGAKRSRSGFTIVELLIVIVVIGVLAAITIVAYNGITNRAKTSAAASAAAGASKKAETYNAETGGYPSQASVLTGAAATTSYQLTGVTINTTAFTTVAPPATQNDLNFYRCGTSAAAAATNLATVTVITGVQFRYWDYGNNVALIDTAGQTSGNSPSGYNITCYITS